MAYDLNGNTLNDGMNTYVWDARNRLASANDYGATFAYDSLGRRIGRNFLAVNTNYVFDGMNAVQETNGTTITANLLTGGIDEYFTRADSSGTSEFLTDSLGSTVALTDSTGNPQVQYSYAPFGAINISGTTNNSYTFTGREIDGLGLYYYRARYYNPSTGRFISEDPLGLSAGTNFYSYVLDDPIDLTDPLGADPCIDIDKMIQWLNANATSHYIKGINGHCAANVRKGFEAGGLNTNGRPRDAKNYGPFLLGHGFSVIPESGYQALVGDTVVFQTFPGDTNDSGHIQVWSGTRWVSDFQQSSTNIYPGPGYRAHQAQHVIYRPTPCPN
jgi:RHS repeat-associated protein